MNSTNSSMVLAMALVIGASLPAAEPGTFDDGHGDRVMGVWEDGQGKTVQVVALGNGAYRAHVFGDVEHRTPPLAVLDGVSGADGAVTFTASKAGSIPTDHPKQHPAWWPAPEAAWSGRWVEGSLDLGPAGGASQRFTPRPIVSPTMGAPAPAGAVVLIGADSSEATIARDWTVAKADKPCPWQLLPGGILQGVPKSGTIISRQGFDSHRLHLEFRLPYEPSHRGQERANSGLYLQGRFEIQILDSFGLQGADNECGGIYKNAVPVVNRCAPPGTWQTYDVDFTAATWEGGVQKAPTTITARHNGFLILDHVTVPAPTASAPNAAGAAPGGVCLQDHGHPVQFRNLWVLPLTNP